MSSTPEDQKLWDQAGTLLHHFAQLSPDEREVFLWIVKRVHEAQGTYGKLNLADCGKRNWYKEACEEFLDASFYSGVIALLAMRSTDEER